MSLPSWTLLRLLPLLALATSAWAQDLPGDGTSPDGPAPELEQTIYKGVVGNVLDAIPMDPAKRVDLQRANAVVSNTVSGRSLAVLAGLSNPVFMVVGLVWGIWSASNIKPIVAGMNLTAAPGKSGGGAAAQSHLVVASAPAICALELPAERRHEPKETLKNLHFSSS